MARLIVIYKTPKDAEAFNKYYCETHIPLAKKIPGLAAFDVSKGQVVSPGEDSGVHLVATLQFADMAALQAGFASPEGQAAAADVQNFADEPPTRLIFDHLDA